MAENKKNYKKQSNNGHRTKSNYNINHKKPHTKQNKVEIVNYEPKPRTVKQNKKTIEVVDPDGDKEIIAMKVLDDYSTFQDILDGVKEFQVVISENELFGDTDFDQDNLNDEEIESKNKELEKKARKVSTHWRKFLKGSLRQTWIEIGRASCRER